jgi:hypothetical protein
MNNLKPSPAFVFSSLEGVNYIHIKFETCQDIIQLNLHSLLCKAINDPRLVVAATTNLEIGHEELDSRYLRIRIDNKLEASSPRSPPIPSDILQSQRDEVNKKRKLNDH